MQNIPLKPKSKHQEPITAASARPQSNTSGFRKIIYSKSSIKSLQCSGTPSDIGTRIQLSQQEGTSDKTKEVHLINECSIFKQDDQDKLEGNSLNPTLHLPLKSFGNRTQQQIAPIKNQITQQDPLEIISQKIKSKQLLQLQKQNIKFPIHQKTSLSRNQKLRNCKSARLLNQNKVNIVHNISQHKLHNFKDTSCEPQKDVNLDFVAQYIHATSQHHTSDSLHTSQNPMSTLFLKNSSKDANKEYRQSLKNPNLLVGRFSKKYNQITNRPQSTMLQMERPLSKQDLQNKQIEYGESSSSRSMGQGDAGGKSGRGTGVVGIEIGDEILRLSDEQLRQKVMQDAFQFADKFRDKIFSIVESHVERKGIFDKDLPDKSIIQQMFVKSLTRKIVNQLAFESCQSKNIDNLEYIDIARFTSRNLKNFFEFADEGILQKLLKWVKAQQDFEKIKSGENQEKFRSQTKYFETKCFDVWHCPDNLMTKFIPEIQKIYKRIFTHISKKQCQDKFGYDQSKCEIDLSQFDYLHTFYVVVTTQKLIQTRIKNAFKCQEEVRRREVQEQSKKHHDMHHQEIHDFKKQIVKMEEEIQNQKREIEQLKKEVFDQGREIENKKDTIQVQKQLLINYNQQITLQMQKGKEFRIKRGKHQLSDIPELTDELEISLDDDLKQLFKNTWSTESITNTKINLRMLEIQGLIKALQDKKETQKNLAEMMSKTLEVLVKFQKDEIEHIQSSSQAFQLRRSGKVSYKNQFGFLRQRSQENHRMSLRYQASQIEGMQKKQRKSQGMRKSLKMGQKQEQKAPIVGDLLDESSSSEIATDESLKDDDINTSQDLSSDKVIQEEDNENDVSKSKLQKSSNNTSSFNSKTQDEFLQRGPEVVHVKTDLRRQDAVGQIIKKDPLTKGDSQTAVNQSQNLADSHNIIKLDEKMLQETSISAHDHSYLRDLSANHIMSSGRKSLSMPNQNIKQLTASNVLKVLDLIFDQAYQHHFLEQESFKGQPIKKKINFNLFTPSRAADDPFQLSSPQKHSEHGHNHIHEHHDHKHDVLYPNYPAHFRNHCIQDHLKSLLDMLFVYFFNKTLVKSLAIVKVNEVIACLLRLQFNIEEKKKKFALKMAGIQISQPQMIINMIFQSNQSEEEGGGFKNFMQFLACRHAFLQISSVEQNQNNVARGSEVPVKTLLDLFLRCNEHLTQQKQLITEIHEIVFTRMTSSEKTQGAFHKKHSHQQTLRQNQECLDHLQTFPLTNKGRKSIPSAPIEDPFKFQSEKVQKFTISNLYQIFNFIAHFDNFDNINIEKFAIWKFFELVRLALRIGIFQIKDFLEEVGEDEEVREQRAEFQSIHEVPQAVHAKRRKSRGKEDKRRNVVEEADGPKIQGEFVNVQKMIYFIINLHDLAGLNHEILSNQEIEVISDKIFEFSGSLRQVEMSKFERFLDLLEVRPTISFVDFNVLIIEQIYPDQVQIEYKFIVTQFDKFCSKKFMKDVNVDLDEIKTPKMKPGSQEGSVSGASLKNKSQKSYVLDFMQFKRVMEFIKEEANKVFNVDQQEIDKDEEEKYLKSIFLLCLKKYSNATREKQDQEKKRLEVDRVKQVATDQLDIKTGNIDEEGQDIQDLDRIQAGILAHFIIEQRLYGFGQLRLIEAI